MDTGTHLLLGVSLAGLACVDLISVQQTEWTAAVMTATVLGSNAPDFDMLVRLRGEKTYKKHHRGMSHSLPALFLWPLVIASPVSWLFGMMDAWLWLYLWTFIAVFFHVFLDWFNAHGVQCFLPISKQWQHLDVLCLFEPFLFAIHAIGVFLWLGFDIRPVYLFPWIYGLTLLYIAVRFIQHRRLLRIVNQAFRKRGIAGVCHLLPTYRWFVWQFVFETEHQLITGEVVGDQIVETLSVEKESQTQIRMKQYKGGNYSRIRYNKQG